MLLYCAQVDEENHRISVSLSQMYYWKDSRIKIDEDHPFWSNGVDIFALDGAFVENCIWIPNFQFKDLIEISAARPTPASPNGSPIKVLLGRTGVLQVVLSHVDMTLSCYMVFDDYPFDQQVRCVYLRFLSV